MPAKEEVPTEQDVYKSDLDYYKTVYLFLILSEEFINNGIEYLIEHDIKNCNNTNVTPDFIISQNQKIINIIEHKASLNESYANKELDSIIIKYGCVTDIQTGKHRFNPQVIGLIPINLLKILEQIRDKNNINLLLSGFDVNLDMEVITFETHDNITNIKLRKILTNIVEFDYKKFTEYKFIKAEPKYVTYCVTTSIWPLLISFNDPNIAKNGYFEIDFNIASKRATEFFPNWIRNNKQLANERLKRGLIFLDKIGFVDWKEGDTTIKVYYTRGRRVGDLKTYFIKKFIEIEIKKAKKRKRRKVDGRFIQTRLFEK